MNLNQSEKRGGIVSVTPINEESICYKGQTIDWSNDG